MKIQGKLFFDLNLFFIYIVLFFCLFELQRRYHLIPKFSDWVPSKDLLVKASSIWFLKSPFTVSIEIESSLSISKELEFTVSFSFNTSTSSSPSSSSMSWRWSVPSWSLHRQTNPRWDAGYLLPWLHALQNYTMGMIYHYKSNSYFDNDVFWRFTKSWPWQRQRSNLSPQCSLWIAATTIIHAMAISEKYDLRHLIISVESR